VCACERTAAENDGADGADGLIISDADIAALRFFLDGHFGNDGNAHARADHTEKAAELAAFENDLRMETSAVAGSNGGIAETVAVAQEQEWFGTEIFEGKGWAGVEFMFFGERGKEPLGQERESTEFVATNGERKDGDVDATGSETVKKDGRDLFNDSEPDLGEFA
jgi:hypothetical protein